MRSVWLAISAVMAVEERASYECLRHQGYASASQKVSKPARSQALAMAMVSPAGKYILQHTGLVFAGRVGGFHHHLFGIVVQFDAESFGDGQTFVNERAEQLASRWKK